MNTAMSLVKNVGRTERMSKAMQNFYFTFMHSGSLLSFTEWGHNCNYDPKQPLS